MALVEQFSDTFTYADGTLVSQASWEQHNTTATVGWDVVSNQAAFTLVNTRDTAQVTGTTFANDQYAKVDVTFGTNGSTSFNAGLGLRIQAPGSSENLYRVVLIEGSTGSFAKVEVTKYVAGSNTSLATSTGEFASADGNSLNLEARISGDDITVYVDGAQIDLSTGSSVAAGGNFSSGVVGLVGFNEGSGTARFDNFSAGDITSGQTGSGSHQAAVATQAASGSVGTLQVSLDLVDVSNTAAPNNTGITAVVYEAAGGTEIHETATASITSGTMVISLPSGTTANNGDEVFVKLHKAGATFNDDLNGAGRATVSIA